MVSQLYKVPLLREKIWVTDRRVVLKRSLSDGLGDLSKLAKIANRESCWIYVHNGAVWVNLTSKYLQSPNDQNGAYDVGVITMVDFDLSKIRGRVTLYHTHPKKLVERGINEKIRQTQNETQGILQSELKISRKIWLKGNYLGSIFPSPDDINAYQCIMEHYGITESSQTSLDFGIISAFFNNQISFVPTKPIEHTVGEYKRMISSLGDCLDGDRLMQTPFDQLVVESYEELNQNDIGLRMVLER